MKISITKYNVGFNLHVLSVYDSVLSDLHRNVDVVIIPIKQRSCDI